MSDLAIRVDHLGKQYRLGGAQATYRTLRETLVESAKTPLRWISGRGRTPSSTFWALDDVSFDVRQGEVLGIIGRNGAGKSTLLKILSRITKPTRGRVELYGRVGSLLEVGTGFHPELTGRENIYLNGAILGMSYREIGRKFDQIVEFSGIERFLDTQVKFYSSGMYVRLAFGVASYLEPEILVVDEVLAVGDAEFQKKSLGRMDSVARAGRTILFVSHNLGAINSLCTKCVWIDKGQVKHIGAPNETVARYLDAGAADRSGSVTLQERDQDAYFTQISFISSDGYPNQSPPVSEPFTIRFDYKLTRTVGEFEVAFILYDRNGSKIFYSGTSKRDALTGNALEPGRYAAEVMIPAKFLAPGSYTISAVIHQPNVRFLDRQEAIMSFSIIEAGSGDHKYLNQNMGAVLVDFEWKVSRARSDADEMMPPR
jgi:lipopolysaccharide transport system ATP-binding protein